MIRNISRASGPFADSNVASHNAGITPDTLRKKHAGPVNVRFKYTIQITNFIPSLPSRSVDAPLRMKPTFSASARAPHLTTDFSRVRRVVAMDPASILRHGQIVTTVGGAVYAQRGIVFSSRYHTPARVSFSDVCISKARAQISSRYAHAPWRFL